MRIIRLVFVALLAFGTVAALSAGGQTEAARGQPELILWQTGTASEIEIMQRAVSEYNNQQDNVVIQWVERPASSEAMATAIAGGRGPDALYWNQNVPWHFGDDSFADFYEFVTDPEIGLDPNRFFTAPRQSVNYGGKVHAIPSDFGLGGVKYNVDMLREAGLDPINDPPQTWSEFEEWALALTIRDADGTVLQWGVVDDSVDWLLQEVMLNNGGDWVNDDLTEYAVPEQSLVEGVAWIQRLVRELEVMPPPGNISWTGAPDAGERPFAEERAAMQIGYHSPYGLINLNPALEGRVGTFPIPQGPSSDGTPKISTGFNGFYAIQPAEHTREVYLFAKFFIENYSVEYAKSGWRIPALAENLDEYEQNPLVSPMLPRLNNPVRNFHVFPGRLDVRSGEPATVERVILGQMSPEESVRRFKEHAANVFDQMSRELAEFRTNHEIVW